MDTLRYPIDIGGPQGRRFGRIEALAKYAKLVGFAARGAVTG